MPLYDPNAPVPNADPKGPIIPQPLQEPVYPKLKYRFSDEYPGFTYVKVNSAEEEKELIEKDNEPDECEDEGAALASGEDAQGVPGAKSRRERGDKAGGERSDKERHEHGELPPGVAAPQPKRARGWFDSPDEARYARALARAPYREFGRDVSEPMFWPVSTSPGVKLAAEVAAMDKLIDKLIEVARDQLRAGKDDQYPKIKYQAIEEAPGYKYYKVESADDEAALSQLGPDPWFDTPSEAIASPPGGAAPERGGQTPGAAQTQGTRPTQSSIGSQPGPTLPEGLGGSPVPLGSQPNPAAELSRRASDDEESDTKTAAEHKEHNQKPKNGGKHK